jgi:hypothetical protein
LRVKESEKDEKNLFYFDPKKTRSNFGAKTAALLSECSRTTMKLTNYRAFHGFGQAKCPDGGLVLGPSLFLILPQLLLKTMLSIKVAKIDSKISNSLH